MVNDAVFGQIFISDTHPERTEMIIKETHQSLQNISNFEFIILLLIKNHSYADSN